MLKVTQTNKEYSLKVKLKIDKQFIRIENIL